MIGRTISSHGVSELLRWIPTAPDYNTWVRIISAVGNTLPEAEAETVLLAWSPDQKPGETLRKLRSRMTRVGYGSLIYQARQHGYAPQPSNRRKGTFRRHYAPPWPRGIAGPPRAPKARKSALNGRDLDVWNEGCAYLTATPTQATQIDSWRGYPPGTTTELAQCGLIASCLLRGQRALAFPVIDHTDLQIGFHARHEPKQGERATWSYCPNGNPALPFVLGAGFAASARRVVVTEGQWDAIALAASLGWLAHDTAFDEHTVILGTRGASGTRPLIEEWLEVVPRDAVWFLIRDADNAGHEGFLKLAMSLREHGRTVTLRRPSYGKDLNEMVRHRTVQWAEITA
jgi:hypothetical protein